MMISLVYRLVAMVTQTEKQGFLGSGKRKQASTALWFFFLPGESPGQYNQLESVLLHLPTDDSVLSSEIPHRFVIQVIRNLIRS